MELDPEDFKQTFAETWVESVKEGKAGLGQRCAVKSVSQADKVPLHKVVKTPVDEDMAGLAEYPDIGGKSIFKSTADVAKDAIRPDVVAYIIQAPTTDSHLPATIERHLRGHTSGAGHRKGLAEASRGPAAKYNTAETAEHIGRKMHIWPEIIQRQTQKAVSHKDTRR
jgi:hypothetical protein